MPKKGGSITTTKSPFITRRIWGISWSEQHWNHPSRCCQATTNVERLNARPVPYYLPRMSFLVIVLAKSFELEWEPPVSPPMLYTSLYAGGVTNSMWTKLDKNYIADLITTVMTLCIRGLKILLWLSILTAQHIWKKTWRSCMVIDQLQNHDPFLHKLREAR